MYSSNATESSDPCLRGPSSLEGLLARNGVAIGFSGHAHIYTRNVEARRRARHLRHGRRRRLGCEPATKCSAPVAYAIGWSYTTGGSACGTLRPTVDRRRCSTS